MFSQQLTIIMSIEIIYWRGTIAAFILINLLLGSLCPRLTHCAENQAAKRSVLCNLITLMSRENEGFTLSWLIQVAFLSLNVFIIACYEQKCSFYENKLLDYLLLIIIIKKKTSLSLRITAKSKHFGFIREMYSCRLILNGITLNFEIYWKST